MSQLDQQVKILSDKVCAFLDGIPSFANGMTDDWYREDNRFPDLSLEALEEIIADQIVYLENDSRP